MQVFLKKGHVRPVWAGHPWVFSQALETRGKVPHGSEVQVMDTVGNCLGRGFYSEGSALAVRLFTRNPEEVFSEELLRKRLESAAQRRAIVGLGQDKSTTGYRLFHGEGDGIPGLIVDRFDRTLVVQLGSAGLHARRHMIYSALAANPEVDAVLDRSSEKSAKAERFERETGAAVGAMPAELRFSELGIEYCLPSDLLQKTGYYFDQRPLRQRISELSKGKRILDLYSYIGSIGLNAARGGAESAVCVDSSEKALEVGRSLAPPSLATRIEFIRSPAEDYLAAQNQSFDLVVSDPPKLAPSRGHRDKAFSMFRRIAGLSVRATRPGGLLALSSCSAAIGIEDVKRALALGARDFSRECCVLESLFQGPDHPVPPAFQEGLYLSTVIAWIE